MARKLKTYQTSLGFFDQAIAAPSMKAALEAWDVKSNLFHQGFAWESDDPQITEATLKTPGVTLRRPVGSKGRFVEHPQLPKSLPASAFLTAPTRLQWPMPATSSVISCRNSAMAAPSCSAK